jgi:Family of unknown function (DUF6174)
MPSHWRRSIVAVALLSSLSGCGDPLGPKGSQLRRAEARWHASEISSYSMVVHRLCFCGQPFVGPARVVVQNGTIVSVTFVPDPTQSVDVSSYPTVEDLFDTIRDGLDHAGSIDVTYDAARGFPTRIAIDWVKNAIDDEITYMVTEFSATP